MELILPLLIWIKMHHPSLTSHHPERQPASTTNQQPHGHERLMFTAKGKSYYHIILIVRTNLMTQPFPFQTDKKYWDIPCFEF